MSTVIKGWVVLVENWDRDSSGEGSVYCDLVFPVSPLQRTRGTLEHHLLETREDAEKLLQEMETRKGRFTKIKYTVAYIGCIRDI